MDENEVEGGFLEDSLKEYIGELIEYARTLEPGSDQQSAVAKSIKELYEICIKYTEIGMKYRSEEDQRQHELEIKKLELDVKDKELKLEEAIKTAQIIEQRKDRNIDAILTGLATPVSALTVATFACLQVTNMKAEYVGGQFMTSGVFKNISSIFGRLIKI